MVLERFWWGPSLDLLWDPRNGALWLEHCDRMRFEVNCAKSHHHVISDGLPQVEQHCTYSKCRDQSDYTLSSRFQEVKNNENGYPLKVVTVTGEGDLQEVITTVNLQLGKVYGVLEK